MIAKSLVKQFFEINKIEENLDRAILRSILEYLKTNDLLKHLIVYLSQNQKVLDMTSYGI